MPLAGPVLGGLIATNFASSGIAGVQSVPLAMAIGNGIVNTILATNFYQGNAVGTGPGPGVGTGVVIGLTPPVVGGNITVMMTSRGIAGTMAAPMAMAIGNAFVTHMATGVVTASGAPVAIGKGTGFLLGVTGMGLQIQGMMTSAGIIGTQAINLALAIGDAIELAIFSNAIVNTVIVGTPAPPPAGPFPMAGVEMGKLA
jgi:hypothetical protein